MKNKVFNKLKSFLGSDISALESRLDSLERMVNNVRFRRLGSSMSGKSTIAPTFENSVAYWTRHNVTNFKTFPNASSSLNELAYRNQQYPGYIELMPQKGLDGKVVLDYGCGPGHDLVGFSIYSKPSRLIAMDVSPTSIDGARNRLKLHEGKAEFIQIADSSAPLPIENESVDYVHCSGVLMLVPDPVTLIKEFSRILSRGGEIRVMTYNKDSLWFHLYVAYIIKIEYGLYPNLSLEEIFAKSTDGEDCPMVHVWSPEEVIKMAKKAGLECSFIGAAPSVWEMAIASERFRALMHSDLNPTSREFLKKIKIDASGVPWVNDVVAGIDGCFVMRH